MRHIYDYLVYIALAAFFLPGLLQRMLPDKIKHNSYPISAASIVAGVVYLTYPTTPARGAPGSIGDYAQMAVDWMDFWIPLAVRLGVGLAALALAYKLYDDRWA